MKYNLEFTDLALKQLDLWRKSGQKKAVNKVLALLGELQSHPMSGTGKVEQLKNELSGYWSRRIDKANRLIYKIEDERIVVVVISVRGHYDNF